MLFSMLPCPAHCTVSDCCKSLGTLKLEEIVGADLTFCQVLVKENGRSFSHFLTNLCAIIGGVFTVGLPALTFLT